MKDLAFLMLTLGLIMLGMMCGQDRAREERRQDDPRWRQESYRPGPPIPSATSTPTPTPAPASRETRQP